MQVRVVVLHLPCHNIPLAERRSASKPPALPTRGFLLYVCHMELKPQDFFAMEFNVTKLPTSKDTIAWFAPRLDFLKPFNRPDYEIRLMILLFDKKSPLSRIKDIAERAAVACEYARIPYDKKKAEYHPEIVKTASGANEVFNYMCCCFMAHMYSDEYAILKSMEEARLRILPKALNGDTEAFKRLEEIEKNIEKRRGHVLQFMHTPFMLDLNRYIIEDNLKLTAESVAFARKRKEPIYPELSQYA